MLDKDAKTNKRSYTEFEAAQKRFMRNKGGKGPTQEQKDQRRIGFEKRHKKED